MAIAMRLRNVQPPRPMTHDLLQSVVEQLEAKVTRVVVCDVRAQTYFAEIHLSRNGTSLVTARRPSWQELQSVRFWVWPSTPSRPTET
jgi:hypothetical protein